MKKPQMFDFYIWNPFKKGIYTAFILNASKRQSAECYLLLAFFFFQIEIDFKTIYYTLKNNQKRKLT